MTYRSAAFACLGAWLYCVPAMAETTPSPVQRWEILPEKSAIEWSVPYGDKAITGTFPRFTADIFFDKGRLNASSAAIRVTTAEFTADDNDAKQYLTAPEWLAVKQFPEAIYAVDTFTFIGNDKENQGAYRADGRLKLRGIEKPLTLNLSMIFFDDTETTPPTRYARVIGEGRIKRADYDLGGADWSSTDAIGGEVTLTVRLEAKQAKQ